MLHSCKNHFQSFPSNIKEGSVFTYTFTVYTRLSGESGPSKMAPQVSVLAGLKKKKKKTLLVPFLDQCY